MSVRVERHDQTCVVTIDRPDDRNAVDRSVAEGIEAALDDFERFGYLSDARYAHALVAQLAGHLGRRAIARDLRERGIAADEAKAALSPLAERDELADATALWQRRFGRAPADERERARQVRFLVSRGFSAATAFRVLRAAGVRTDDLQDS